MSEAFSPPGGFIDIPQTASLFRVERGFGNDCASVRVTARSTRVMHACASKESSCGAGFVVRGTALLRVLHIL